jgi:hypothetical protein
MLNSISNFFNIIFKAKAVKDQAQDDDLIVLGTPDFRFNGGYQPTVIKVKDFVKNLKQRVGGGTALGPVCDLKLEQKPLVFGPLVNFSKSNYGSEVDVIIPGVLEITRGNNQGIFNIAVEGSFQQYTSPADTEWASLYTDPSFDENDYTSYPNFNYVDWTYSRNFSLEQPPNYGQSLVGQWFVMRHIPTGRYWKITFTQWTSQNQGGGFAYERQEVVIPELCKITFSDDTKLNSVSGLVLGNGVTENKDSEGFVTYFIDSPDIQYSNVAFVDPINGNDFTAQVGVFNKPFLNIFTALNAVEALGPYTETNRGLVYLRKGVYSFLSVSIRDKVDMHAEAGVIVTGGSGFSDFTSTGKRFRLTGNAVFQGNINWLFTINSDAQVELNFYSADVRGLVQCNNTARVVINHVWSRLSCFNGGGYGISPRDNTYLEVNAERYIESQQAMVFARTGITSNWSGRCIIRAPRMEVVPVYTSNYGNIFKCFYTHAFPLNAYVEFEGEMVISSSVPAAGGDGRSGFALVNSTNSNQWDLVIKGNVFVANNECIRRGFQAFYGRCRVYGDLKSLISPINTNNLNSTSVGDFTFEFHNTKFYGFALICGRGSKTYFKDCSFYNYADGSTFPTAPNISFQTSNAPLGSEYYFYNCIAETNGASSEFLENGSVPTILGLWNTVSNRNLGVGSVDAFGGFSQISGINVPKLL